MAHQAPTSASDVIVIGGGLAGAGAALLVGGIILLAEGQTTYAFGQSGVAFRF